MGNLFICWGILKPADESYLIINDIKKLVVAIKAMIAFIIRGTSLFEYHIDCASQMHLMSLH